jgi:hypothetical protein
MSDETLQTNINPKKIAPQKESNKYASKIC